MPNGLVPGSGYTVANERSIARRVVLHTLGTETNAVRELWEYARQFEISNTPVHREQLEFIKQWCVRWNFNASWVHIWATESLPRWFRAGPNSLRSQYDGWDDYIAANFAASLVAVTFYAGQTALEVEAADALHDGDPNAMSLWKWDEFFDEAPPLAPPNPQRESRKEFVARAERAWDEATRLIAPANDYRELQSHARWLVEYQTDPKATFDSIIGMRGDASTARKGVRKLASIIKLPLREARRHNRKN